MLKGNTSAKERISVQAIMDAFGESALIIDDNGTVIMANEAGAAGLGVSRGRLIGSSIYDLLPDEAARDWKARVDQAVTTGGQVRFTDTLSGRQVLTRIHPIAEGKGEAQNLAVVWSDNAELRRVRERLAEIETKYRNYVKNAVDIVFTVDVEGNVIEANEAFLASGGYEAADVNDKDFSFMVHPDDMGIVMDAFVRGKEGEITNFEMRAKRKDDTFRWFSLINRPVMDEEGRVVAIHGVARDISDRKQAEAELFEVNEVLRETEKRQKAILDNIPDIAWLKDKESRFIAVNRPFGRACGFTPEELVGKTDLDIWPKELAERYQADDREVIRSGMTKIVDEPLADVEGKVQWIATIKAPTFNDHGEVIGTTGIARDITERRQIEEKLREQAEILDQIHDIVVTTDTEGTITNWNHGAERLIGYLAQEMLGQNIAVIYPKEDFESIKERVALALRKQGFLEDELRLIRKDGSDLFVHLTLTRKKDRDDKTTGIIGSAVDITERRRAEAALKKEQQDISLILDKATTIIFYTDTEGKFIRVNKRFARGLGMTEEEIVGKTVFDLFSPKNAEGMTRDDQEVIKSGRPKLGTIEQNESPDGMRWIQTDKIPVFDEDNNVVAIAGFAQDITERKEAEEALKESEERFRHVAESAGEWIWEVDANGLYTYASPVVEKIIGYRPEEIVGKKYFYDLFHPEDGESFKAVALTAFAAKQPFREFINRNVHKNGQTIWLATSGSPLLDDKGNLLGYRGADTDITDRKRAEEELKRSEEKFRGIAEIVPEAFYIYSLETNRYEYLSPAFEVLFGRSVTEHYENPQLWYEAVHPDDRDRVSKVIFESLDKGFEVDFRIIQPDGSLRWVFSRAFPAKDERGNIVRLFGANQDITDRKRAEEALKESEQRYRSLFEQNPDGVYSFDLAGNFLSVNRSTCAVTGYSEEELLSASFEPFVVEEYREKTRHHFTEAARGRTQRFESCIVAKDGRRIWLDVTNVPIVIDGKIVGVYGIAKDISEKKKAEEALTESEEEYRELVENIQDIIYVMDGNGRFRFINKRVLDALGYDEGYILSQEGMDLLTPESQQRSRIVFERQLAGEDVGPFELQLIRKDGSILYLETREKLVWKDDRVVEVHGIGRDISERKEAEEKLVELNKALFERAAELRSSNRELEEFAYVASHDLQEPLRAVASFSQLLSRRYGERLDDDARDFIGYIVDGSVRMQRLINDLLTFSRVGTKGRPFEPTDANTALGQAIVNVGAAIEEGGVVVTNDDLPAVTADGAQLVQLFQNLIGNAVKFRSAGRPSVHVSAARGDGEWVFSLKDNGIGIDPQYVERIFVIFQRLHGRDEYPGTGIGLAICKKIVERHRGRIWVESDGKSGSTFYFTIPFGGGEQR